MKTKIITIVLALAATTCLYAQTKQYDFQAGNLYYEIMGILDADLLKKECYNTFTTISVIGDEQWTYSANYGAMMNGWRDLQTNPNEDWLISPAVNLSGKTSVRLRFFHAFGPKSELPISEDAKSQYSLWISNDFVDRVENATWTELKGMTYSTKAWEYIWSEDIYIPQEYLTENCRIAWKYTCVDECATWEIKNISLVDMSPYSAAVAVVSADSKLTHIEIPDSVEHNGFFYQVKQIKDRAFSSCESLVSIKIPQNIDTIGEGVLLYCDSLQSIVVDSKNKTYDSRDNCNAIIETKSNVLIHGCNNSIIPTGVTRIGDKAFCSCTDIDSIVIPSSVTTIGESAFEGCRSLRKIDMSENVTNIGNYAFASCWELKSIALPPDLTDLSDGVFMWCDSLCEINIPDNVTTIGRYAFKDCYSLKSINIPSAVVSIESDAFDGCYFLNDKFINHSTLNAIEDNYWGATIGDEEYEGLIIKDKIVIGCRQNVTSANIPNHIIKIKTKAFNQCVKLKSVYIPNSVKDIDTDAFVSCYSLSDLKVDNSNTTYDSRNNCNAIIESVSNRLILGCQSTIIPNDVTIIGRKAFCSCHKLSSILLPNSITTIEDSAFYECAALDYITIPENTTMIGQSAFSLCKSLQYVLWNAKKCNDFFNQYYSPFVYEVFDAERNNHIKSFVFGDDVEYIPAYLCYGMNNLTTLTIPENIKSIGEKAFVGCTSLSSIVWNAKNCQDYFSISPFNDSKNIISSFTFGNNVERIPTLLCSGMNSLSSIEIPNSVTSIDVSAFNGCSSLTSVIIPNSVTSIGKYAFYECSSLTSVTIGESVTSIGDLAFNGCSKIDSIVWKAENYANFLEKENAPFYDCRSQIKFFTFGETVEHISAYLCYGMEKLTNIVLFNKTKTIGTSAFEGCIRLGKVTLGSSIQNIAAKAFAGCTRLYDVYCYATYPPFADATSFANYNAYLYVPCENQRDYTLDKVWGNFKFIECITSEDVSTDGVVITPTTNDVTIIWPTEIGADTYTIVIKKGHEVFCTLTFNADGQLLNIAFAPGRNGNHPVQYAEQAGNGYRFTVTGLEEGTHYAYNIDVRDAANKTIKSHTGEFTTESMTAVENITTNNASIQKILRDGQLLILRDGVEYTIMGQEL